jgi:serine/threonine-protein phosphatase 6 regulatory ankyrin repeat subunit B
VAKPNYQSEELRMIYSDASAHEICAQIIFSTFLSQVVPQWSLINDINVHYGTTRKLYSFRLLSQTVTDIVEILEKSGLATVESAYVNVISALQICQALPKSTDPAALLSLLKGVKQQEDDGLGDEADDVVLWLSHQVEMASKSYRANEAWEDAGAVYWNYYAACKEVYSSSPRTDDAARRMGRFEAIACNLRESKLLKSKKWTDVKNTSEAYKKSSQRQPQSIPPPISANWGPIWKAIIEEDVPCLIGLLKENSTSIDGRGYNGRTPLIQASYQGFDAAVELLISKKADVGAKDDEDQTSLHHAIQNKHSGVMEILLLCDRKIQFDVDVAGRTPLSIAMIFDYTKLVKLLNFYDVDDIGRCHACRGAIERGNLGFLQQLLEKGIEPDARDESGRTPLSWAAGNGQETFIKLLLEKGASPVSNNDSGRGPLWWAAKNGQVTVVELLLTKGADIEVRDYAGRTALMEAAANGQPSVVELLLRNGAKIGAKGHLSQTALIEAADNGHTSVVELLLTNGANIEAKDENKQTALINAAAHGHTGVVEHLLIKGASIEAKDYGSQTALMHAAVHGHTGVVELLLIKGASIEAKDNLNQTALGKAAANGHTSVVELLLTKGANIEAKDDMKETALIEAAKNGHSSVVELLLIKGANIEEKDYFSETALIKAAVNGHSSVVKLLLTKGANVKAKNKYGLTALFWAIQKQNSAIIKLLEDAS